MNLWLRLFLAALCVVSFVQLLIPEGKYEKYLNSVVSLLFVISVAVPFVEWIFKLDYSRYLNEAKLELYSHANGVQTETLYEELVFERYAATLVNELKAEYASLGVTGIKEIQIFVENTVSLNLGQITGIYVTVSESNKTENEIILIASGFYKVSDGNIYVVHEPSEEM